MACEQHITSLKHVQKATLANILTVCVNFKVSQIHMNHFVWRTPFELARQTGSFVVLWISVTRLRGGHHSELAPANVSLYLCGPFGRSVFGQLSRENQRYMNCTNVEHEVALVSQWMFNALKWFIKKNP